MIVNYFYKNPLQNLLTLIHHSLSHITIISINSIISFFISLIDAIFSYFQSLHEFKYYSLKSYAQVVKILLYLVGVILVISLLLNKSPIAFYPQSHRPVQSYS